MSDAKYQSPNTPDIASKLNDIEQRYNNSCASNHIMFATWFAHYKFFWEQQIAWIDEQRKFGFFRDKVPLTFWIFLIVMAVFVLLKTEIIMTHVCEFIPTKGVNS